MLKKIIIASLSLLMLVGNGFGQLLNGPNPNRSEGDTGTLEKMIVANGNVSMDLDLNLLNGNRSGAKNTKPSELRFEVERDSFFTVLVFNNELRGPLPSAMKLIPQTSAALPGKLNGSFSQLVVENLAWGGEFELAVRDGRTGYTFFNIEGHTYDYAADNKGLSIQTGRLLLSKEYATELGRQALAGTVVGKISINANLRPIEVTQIENGEVKSEKMPASLRPGADNLATPGPDVVVGDLSGLASFGADSTYVGLAIGTDSCNFGTVDLNWFAFPSNDHPAIPQNIYRMSGGADNAERFEQIGQSAVKHGFTALTNNLCNLGCNGVGGTRLGVGCSDPYSAGLNAGPNLGSRAWINPFTGFFPRSDSATNPNNHSGHNHTGPAHRMLTKISDLNTSLNPGASYFAEGQYVTPHEYTWCQSNPSQCNMFNNVSYRKYNVTGTTSFSFSPAAPTVRTQPAVRAWTGATFVDFEPARGADGMGTVAYKVTNPSPGVWHYEYAVYNMNLDRAIQSFGVPVGSGATLSNIGFSAPPQQLPSTNDGTTNSAGFSNAAWAQSQAGGLMTWNSETFAQNPNANAIRWGTLYSFRFDSNRPPQNVDAVVGFYKTGAPITVPVQGPSPATVAQISISGRIVASGKSSVSNATVTLTGPNNFVRTFTTGAFGTYVFDSVPAGVQYTISVSAGRYQYAPQTVTPSDNVIGFDFNPLVQP